jgi:prepilin-type N-terminal cleavage/methylation domain-containing protein
MNAARFNQRGLSLVELLVGMAVALVVCAGALKLLASHVESNRRVLLEARLHQDLRAAADLVARDLRRAGYWQSALKATVWPGQANPYRALAASAGLASYGYSRDAVENDTLDGNESFGLRLAAGALQMQDGSGGWQQMTDTGTVLVTSLSITPATSVVSLGHLCTPACSSADPACPALAIRRYEIAIRGRAAADAGVTREVRESLRVRNDDVFPAGCP